jgi:hypothetical protein
MIFEGTRGREHALRSSTMLRGYTKPKGTCTSSKMKRFCHISAWAGEMGHRNWGKNNRQKLDSLPALACTCQPPTGTAWEVGAWEPGSLGQLGDEIKYISTGGGLQLTFVLCWCDQPFPPGKLHALKSTSY